MSDRVVGWMFVGVQAALLMSLILPSGGDDWATPRWLDLSGTGLVATGLGVVGIGALGLGTALTPTPVPMPSASLRTTGLYKIVRHPIYSGVLTIVIGLVVRSGSWAVLAVGLLTIGFFNVKAAWEERRLAMRYPEYDDYASRTPRFMPRLGRGATP